MIRGYLDTCLEVPWNIRTRETLDIARAKKLLDEDHFGLDKVKERIIEFLAVRKLAPDVKGGVHLPGGAAGHGQDEHRHEHRPRHQPQALPRGPRRRARRSGGARPPQDLHRRHAGAARIRAHPGREHEPADGARRDRQAGQRLPRRPLGRAAGGARLRAELPLPRQLHGDTRRPFRRALHHHRQHYGHHTRGRCSTAWR